MRRIHVKRVIGASVVVDEGLEVASSGKVRETRNKKILSKLECTELLQIGDNNNVSLNIHPSVNNTNPHVPLLIMYRSSHILFCELRRRESAGCIGGDGWETPRQKQR